MPSLTARTTRRGSFAGAGLAFSAKASSEMSPGGGGVAGNPCVFSGPLPAALRRQGWDEAAAVRGVDVRAARRTSGDELVDLYPGSGAITEAWRRCTGALRVTGDVSDVDAHRAASSGMCAPGSDATTWRWWVMSRRWSVRSTAPGASRSRVSTSAAPARTRTSTRSGRREQHAARGGRARLLHRAGDRAGGVG